MSKPTQFHRCWTEAAIERYFTTEAMSKDEAAFMEVHLPIDRIMVDQDYKAFQDLGGAEYTSEEGLRRHILKSIPAQPNRIFSLVGETGSGKSELCQWLYYKIQDGIHVPILIRRSMIRLRDIVNEINRHLNEAVTAEIKDITDLWEEAVSKQLVASMFMHLQRSEVLDQIGDQDAYRLRQLVDTSDFELKMRQNFIEYRDEVQRLDKAREPNLLSEEDFRDLVVQSGGLKNPRVCYQHLQRAITDCLASTLQVEDLIGKIKRISDTFKSSGQRSVLLIEDVTTFGFLQNDLLDYLFDLASGNYDVVIGVTTGFEKANEQQIYGAQQTIRERIEGRFVLTDEQKSDTLFLRDKYEELATLYLRAIKDDECPICNGDTELDNVFGKDLYPFNRQFLHNVYSNLQQDGSPKQTPRLFLRALRHTLLAEGMRPFESVEILNILRPPTAWFAQSPHYGSDLEKLLQWYGYSYNKGVFLPKRIAQVFDVSVPTDVEAVNSYYRFNLRPGVERLLPLPPFTIADKTGPSIIRLEPCEGLTGTPNTVHIEGSNFKEDCVARLGETILNTIRVSATHLRASVPADLAIGTHNLAVTNPDDSSATYFNAYTVREPASPSISQVQPDEGDSSQPNEVYIEGSNFQTGCVVHLGTTSLNTNRLSSMRLRATVPANIQAGTYDLTATNPDGKNTTRFNAYTVKVADVFGQLDQWLARQSQFPRRELLKDGTWKLLDFFQFTPFVLQHPFSIAKGGTSIVYIRGDRDSKIYLHDSADSLQPGYLKLTVYPEQGLKDLYSQVLAVGLGNYEVNDADSLDHPWLYDWLNGCVDELQEQMKTGLKSALNMPLEQFIVLAKFLLLNNATGLWKFTPENMARSLAGKPFAVPSMGERPQQLFEWRHDIQALFVSFFHLRDSILDYPYLSTVMAECDPLQALSRLRAIDSTQVYDAYRIGFSRDAYSLRNLVKIVSLYARDLLSLQQGGQLNVSPSPERLKTIMNLVTPPEEIKLKKLRMQLDKLRQLCTHSSISWQRRWDLRLDPLHTAEAKLDFQNFARRVTTLLSHLDEGNHRTNVFAFLPLQREAQAIVGSSEYEVLETIHDIDQSIGRSLATRSEVSLEESAEYQTFKQTLKLFSLVTEQ